MSSQKKKHQPFDAEYWYPRVLFFVKSVAWGRGYIHVEDLVQDCMIRLYRKWPPPLPPDKDPTSWVATVVRNACYDSLRTYFLTGTEPNPIKNAIPTGDVPQTSIHADTLKSRVEPVAHHNVSRKEESKNLWRMMYKHLPGKYRLILVMKILLSDTYTEPEIAGMLGINPSTFKVMSLRARKMLEPKLKATIGEEYA